MLAARMAAAAPAADSAPHAHTPGMAPPQHAAPAVGVPRAGRPPAAHVPGLPGPGCVLSAGWCPRRHARYPVRDQACTLAWPCSGGAAGLHRAAGLLQTRAHPRSQSRGYFTRPSLKRLQRMRSRQLQARHAAALLPCLQRAMPDASRSARLPDAGGARVQALEGFVVGERGVGEAAFIGPVDVLGLDLDSIVHFGRGRVQMYGLSQGPLRPPPGRGLNVPALLTFRCAQLSRAAACVGSPVRAPSPQRARQAAEPALARSPTTWQSSRQGWRSLQAGWAASLCTTTPTPASGLSRWSAFSARTPRCLVCGALPTFWHGPEQHTSD